MHLSRALLLSIERKICQKRKKSNKVPTMSWTCKYEGNYKIIYLCMKFNQLQDTIWLFQSSYKCQLKQSTCDSKKQSEDARLLKIK